MVPPRWNCGGGKVWPLTWRGGTAPRRRSHPRARDCSFPGPGPVTGSSTGSQHRRCRPQSSSQHALPAAGSPGATNPWTEAAPGVASSAPGHRPRCGQSVVKPRAPKGSGPAQGGLEARRAARSALPPAARRAGKAEARYEEARRGPLLALRGVLPPSVGQRVVAVGWSAANPQKNLKLCCGVWRRTPGRGGPAEEAPRFLPGFCPVSAQLQPCATQTQGEEQAPQRVAAKSTQGRVSQP